VVVAGGAAAIAADVAVDEDVDVELLLLLCEPASPMTISTAMTAKTMTHLGTDCFFFGNPPAAGSGAAGPQFLPSEARLPAPDGSGYQPGAGGGGCVIAETVRAPRAVCRWFGVEHRVADWRRDDFPNNFVGDLVKTDSGWVVVPPMCCPEGHDYGEDGWSVSSVWCTCNGRHMAWRCWCAAVLRAAAPGRAADSETSARTAVGAADEHTTVVPDLHPTQAAPELAWSAEPEPEPDPGPLLLVQAN
jgi:hypothetical protein